VVVRTLVVDDEEDMRLLLSAVITIENQGLSVVGEAAGGREAIERVKELSPDAVVLDQRMPDMTGIETARALLDDNPDLHVVIYTAFVDDETVDTADSVGVQAVVSKGDQRGLIDALRRYRQAPGGSS
jgi:NarL family two-component system response regulator LiaR